MRNILKFSIFVILFGFNATAVFAQSKKKPKKPIKDSTYLIILKNDDEIIGTIVSENDREIVILESLDLIKTIVPKDIIASKVLNTNRRKIVKNNPHPSRYLFCPSAFPLKKKEGYLNSFLLYIYQAQYGITDELSAGITTSIITMPFLMNVKYTVPSVSDFKISFGGQMGKLYWNDNKYVMLGFVTGTYGTKNNNVSMNLGFGTYNNESMYLATLSGITRLSNRTSLMAEVWYCEPTGGTSFFMGGPALRVYRDKSATFDIGLAGVAFKEVYYYQDYNPNTQTSEMIENIYWNIYFPIPVISASIKF